MPSERLDVFVRLRGLRQFAKGAGRAAAMGGILGNSWMGAGRRMGVGTALMLRGIRVLHRNMMGLTAIAGIAGFGLAKSFMGFEDQMRRVAAVTTDSVGEVKGGLVAMGNIAIDEASKFKFSNEQAAQSLYILASAGLSAQESVDALHGTMSLAQATGASLKESTYLQTAAINTFGVAAKDASSVADLLTVAVNASALEVADLSYSFKYAAGPAQSAGVGITDLTTALMVMAQGGIRGQRAGTSLRMSFRQLIDPTAKAKGAMADLGLTTKSFVSADGGLKDLGKIIPLVSARLQKLPKAQRAATVAALVGVNAWSGFQTLLNQSPKFWDKFEKKARKSFGNVASEADMAARLTQQSTRAALENTGNMIQGFFIKILMRYSPQIQAFLLGIGHWFQEGSKHIPAIIDFLRPFWDTFVSALRLIWTIGKDALKVVAVGLIVLRKVMKPLGALLDWVNEHWDTIRTTLIGVGAILTVIYAVKLAKSIIFWTRFGLAAVKLNFAIMKTAGIIKGLSIIFATSPVTIWIVGIGLLILGLILLWKRFKWFRDAVWAVINFLKKHWEWFVGGLFGPLGIAIVALIKNWDTFKSAVASAWDKIKQIFWVAWNWIDKHVIGPLRRAYDLVKDIVTLGGLFGGGTPFNELPAKQQRAVTLRLQGVFGAQEGGITRTAGLVRVGERGPEVLSLPSGARIDPLPAEAPAPLDLSAAGIGVGTIHTHVYLDRREIAEAVHKYVQDRQARR